MSAPRLTFLYPFLFAPVKSAPAPFRHEVSRTGRQVFRTAARRSQTQRTARYGKANEPLPYLGGTQGIAPAKDAAPRDAKALPQPPPKPQTTDAPTPSTSTPTPTPTSASTLLDSQESHPAGPSPQPPNTPSPNPLETVLNMPPSDSNNAATATATTSAPAPASADGEQTEENQDQGKPTTEQLQKEEEEKRPRPPHISAPAFVHHFDTYGLVKRLEGGGWTQPQAVTIMKAVRLILSGNMDLAGNALVSKSNVENETYLFRAACSELHTEVNTKRKAEAERSRTERTQLQHEVEILGQRLTQEGGNLKDELKGMFDDRKMSVQNEQRDIERKIQELNYRITIILNSDSRSDVEGVRWIITKRAITALAICVGLILGSLKFSSTAATWQEEERKRLSAMTATSNNSNSGGSSGGPSGGSTQPDDFLRDSGSPVNDRVRDELGQGEILVRQGDNPAFVSLG